jgi:hypothetical protein
MKGGRMAEFSIGMFRNGLMGWCVSKSNEKYV